MNEKTLLFIRYAGYALLVIGMAISLWLLFRDIRTGTEPDYRVHERLEDTAREQQKAGDSLAEIRRGLDDSEASVERIDDGITDDTERAGTIQDRTADAAASVDSIAERNSRVADKLADAEIRNAEAAAAIDDAARAISDCSQLNRGSTEILGRYTDRNTTK